MKRNSLHRWLLATALLLNVAFCWSQEGNNNPDQFIYVVQFAEIQSEEDLKDFDGALRPLFDVVGFYNPDNMSVTFKTTARLTQETITHKLSLSGLHVQELSIIRPEHTNSSKR